MDKAKNFTPRRVIWSNKKCSSVFTDHFPVEIVLSGMPRNKQKAEKATTWNFVKPVGWDNYEKLTDMRGEEIDTITKN